MTIPIRQSTAAQEIPLGYFLDSTNGDTEETGLTIANTDIKLWKHGATTLANKNSGGATHISNSIYYCVLDATDSNTLGGLVIYVHVAGALAIKVECVVYPAHIYDSIIAGTDKQEVDVVQLSSSAQSLLDLKDFADEGYDPSTNKVQGVLLTDTCTTLTGHTAQTGDTYARIGAAGASLTDLGGMSTGMKAEVENEVDDALVAQKLDHLVAVADADDVVDNAIIAKLAASGATADWSTFVNTTDSSQAIRDRGDAAWITGGGGSDKLLMVDTTIATLASQTSFTLTSGSADDDAYNNCTIVIEDASTATQKAMGIVSGYTGATKTVTLKYDPAVFAMAVSDKVYILAENALKATLANRQINVASDGDIAGNVDGSVASVTGHTPQTGDSYARLGAPVAASISADIAALEDLTVADIIAGVTDGSLDLQEMMRVILAACVCKSSGGGTNTIVFRDSADSKNRATATVDVNGNRTAVTLDGA